MRIINAVLLAGVALSARPAITAETLKYGAAPPWVVPAAIPPPPAKSDAPVTILLNDQQIAFDRGRIVTYSEGAMRIQNSQGLVAGNISFAWDPATDTVTINKLQILRGGKVIDVLAGGQTFTVMRRESNLEMAMLDGSLTANIQPEGLQEGDTIVLATTVESSDPVLKGHVEALYAPWNTVPFLSAHTRLSWPATMPVTWRQSPDLPPGRTSRSGDRMVLELAGKDIQPQIAPKGAPPRFSVGRLGEATDFHSWSQVADLFAPLYRDAAVIAPTGTLRDELNRIRSSTTDRKSRAEQALAAVQGRTRYVGLFMGQGSYVPASAEETWKRRFGDCKAKTALLLALLHELGIEAEPVLVNATAGDVLGDRLPMVALFNHVLVRAHINGKSYWLDGTRTGDASLDAIDVPDFGWGLPLVANAKLVSIVPPPLNVPLKERVIDIDATAGIYAPAKTTVHELYRSDDAVTLNSAYSQLTSAQKDELLRRTAKQYFDDLEITSSSAEFDKDKRQFDITIKGTAKLGWKDGWFFVPTSSIAFDPDFDRTGSVNRDAPLAVSYPRFVKDVATVRLPPQVAAKQKLDPPVNETLAGVEYRRSETISGNSIVVESSERGLVPEVPYKEALAAKARLKNLNDDDVYLRAPDDYQLSAADAKARLGDSPGSAQEYFDRGLQLLNAQNFDAAISDFNEALKLKPNEEWALANRAMSLVWKMDYAAAEKDLESVGKLNPSNPVALRAHALMAEQKGDYQQAIDGYDKSLQRDPRNTFTVGRKVRLLHALGRDDQALAESERALKSAPELVDMRVLRANILLGQGNRDAVAREAELLMQQNPDSDYAFVAAGKIYARIDRSADAMKAFDRALAIKPAAYIYVNRAEARPALDKTGRLADLDAALKLEPGYSDALADKADELGTNGDFKAAAQLYDQASKADPDNNYFGVSRAVMLFKAGDKAAAEKLLADQRAKAKGPVELNNLCWLKATAGILLEDAMKDCRDSLKLAPEAGGTLDSMAFVMLRLGRLDEAIALYDRAIAKKTGSASYMGRALAYARKGDKAHAEADRAQALKMDPGTEARFAGYGLKIDEGSARSGR